jgi:hypothetical protein
MNLASLNVYQAPNSLGQGVNWNQMSDRSEPHLQPFSNSSGSTYHGSSIKRSITRLRPGAMSPGGVGVDIKHNSYDRYLNRIKGKAPLKRGVVPPTFGVPYIPFNLASPVYGGKTMKMSIVNGCNCPDGSNNDSIIYDNPYTQQQEYNLGFGVGQVVYAKEGTNNYYSKATIIIVHDYNSYLVQFEDNTQENKTLSELTIYPPCNCSNSEEDVVGQAPSRSSIYSVGCI